MQAAVRTLASSCVKALINRFKTYITKSVVGVASGLSICVHGLPMQVLPLQYWIASRRETQCINSNMILVEWNTTIKLYNQQYKLKLLC
jgi:hypothetical protein